MLKPHGTRQRRFNKKNDYLQGFKFQVAKADQGDRDKPFGPVATTGRD